MARLSPEGSPMNAAHNANEGGRGYKAQETAKSKRDLFNIGKSVNEFLLKLKLRKNESRGQKKRFDDFGYALEYSREAVRDSEQMLGLLTNASDLARKQVEIHADNPNEFVHWNQRIQIQLLMLKTRVEKSKRVWEKSETFLLNILEQTKVVPSGRFERFRRKLRRIFTNVGLVASIFPSLAGPAIQDMNRFNPAQTAPGLPHIPGELIQNLVEVDDNQSFDIRDLNVFMDRVIELIVTAEEAVEQGFREFYSAIIEDKRINSAHLQDDILGYIDPQLIESESTSISGNEIDPNFDLGVMDIPTDRDLTAIKTPETGTAITQDSPQPGETPITSEADGVLAEIVSRDQGKIRTAVKNLLPFDVSPSKIKFSASNTPDIVTIRVDIDGTLKDFGAIKITDGGYDVYVFSQGFAESISDEGYQITTTEDGRVVFSALGSPEITATPTAPAPEPGKIVAQNSYMVSLETENPNQGMTNGLTIPANELPFVRGMSYSDSYEYIEQHFSLSDVEMTSRTQEIQAFTPAEVMNDPAVELSLALGGYVKFDENEQKYLIYRAEIGWLKIAQITLIPNLEEGDATIILLEGSVGEKWLAEAGFEGYSSLRLDGPDFISDGERWMNDGLDRLNGGVVSVRLINDLDQHIEDGTLFGVQSSDRGLVVGVNVESVGGVFGVTLSFDHLIQEFAADRQAHLGFVSSYVKAGITYLNSVDFDTQGNQHYQGIVNAGRSATNQMLGESILTSQE